MSDSSPLGRAITQNIRFISRLGAECDQLIKLIRESLSARLLTPELAMCFRADGGWLNAYTQDEQNWVTTEIGASLPLIRKTKKAVGGYLIVQISLTGPGINAEDNHEPLLHIGWWAGAIDFNTTLMAFPLDPDTGYDITLEADRLFRWTHRAFDDEWCYSLRLTDINNPTDVLNQVVNPVQALLLGSDASAALAGTVAVRYGKVDDRAGHYRVV